MFQISRKCQRDKVFFCECKMGLCLAETLSDESGVSFKQELMGVHR